MLQAYPISPKLHPPSGKPVRKALSDLLCFRSPEVMAYDGMGLSSSLCWLRGQRLQDRCGAFQTSQQESSSWGSRSRSHSTVVVVVAEERVVAVAVAVVVVVVVVVVAVPVLVEVILVAVVAVVAVVVAVVVQCAGKRGPICDQSSTVNLAILLLPGGARLTQSLPKRPLAPLAALSPAPLAPLGGGAILLILPVQAVQDWEDRHPWIS